MLTVKLTCQKCNKEFSFSPSDYSIKGLSNLPKRCPSCCDIRKTERVVVERNCLELYENVFIQNLPFKLDRQTDNLYDYYYYGGSNFGKWGGKRYDKKYYIYIHKDINVNEPLICNIREMEKIYKLNNEIHKSIYFVIEPATSKQINFYLTECKSYYKYTFKGYGRQINYKEYPYFKIDMNYITLMNVSSWANSTRYGNNYKIYLTREPIEIITEGEP